MKILSVIGTRPEVIKMAPVLFELQRRADTFQSLVCLTAQHRHLLDQMLAIFRIRADSDFDIMTHDQSLTLLHGELLKRLEPVIQKTRPDCILAQGDTTTVLAAAMVAFYQHIPFGHVEAGLRSGDLQNPFPEEFNRRVADSVATFLFAPTERARQNLLAEGLPAERISVCGNTVVDALQHITQQPAPRYSGELEFANTSAPLVLVTAHRRESFGGPLENICQAVHRLAVSFREQGVQFCFPVHPNPQVRTTIHKHLKQVANIHLVAPLDYLHFVYLLKQATLVLTDSGGIQEEAPSFHVPVLVMRETTERPEGVEAGVARLVGTQTERIFQEAARLLANPAERARMGAAANPYGDGLAAKRISDILAKGLNYSSRD